MKNYNVHLLFSLVVAGVMGACVKDPQDIPPGLTSDPVFHMEATLDNEAVALEAGVSAWTMLPVVDEEDSLTVYTSIWSKDGCLNQCAPSWVFRFYQAWPGDQDPETQFSNSIKTGPKLFVPSDQQLDSFKIIIATDPGIFMNGYSYWQDLNNPSTSYYHEYQNTVGYQENINVCFQSLAYTGCQYSQCIYFDPVSTVPCLSSIQARLENARHLVLSVKPEGTPPFQINWFNGSTSSNTIVTLQDSVVDVFASVSVTDGNGNKSDLSQSIRVQNGIVDACYFPILLSSTPIHQTSPMAKSNRLEIIYTDADGLAWRSSAGIQPADASALISQIEAYGPSPSNQLSYIVDLSIKASLFNAVSGESKVFQTSSLSLALSHP